VRTGVIANWVTGAETTPELSAESEVSSSRGAPRSVEMLSQAIADRYRCPDNFVQFALRGQLSEEQGYFQFGDGAVCYGHLSSENLASHASGLLHDALNDVDAEDGTLQLPFDPTEIIDNLRLERYVDGRGIGGNFQSILKKIYYLFRPFASLEMRKRVQRFRARNWERVDFPHWPVDTTVEDICERLLLSSMQAQGVERVPFIWFWPAGARGCVVMTHDVETHTGVDFCEPLMDLDDAYGMKASFQIVPGGKYHVPSQLLESIRDRGFEVGIQDLNHDGRLYDNRSEFLRRAEIINRHAREYGALGFRAAVLYRRPEWFPALNFSYDMSIPNVAHLDPQQGGCCTVLPYFIGNMLELPVTTIQDYMLFHILGERSIDLWKTQIEMILKKNGMASFIIHPDYINEAGAQAAYKELLAHLQLVSTQKQVWRALPREVNAWWRERSQMRIERDGSTWRIRGDRTGQAVLAYARVSGGKLIYELETRQTQGAHQ
jgi:peptidoglycan/xylan/chitin deacetylase (PgdA/CDA1 family)